MSMENCDDKNMACMEVYGAEGMIGEQYSQCIPSYEDKTWYSHHESPQEVPACGITAGEVVMTRI